MNTPVHLPSSVLPDPAIGSTHPLRADRSQAMPPRRARDGARPQMAGDNRPAKPAASHAAIERATLYHGCITGAAVLMAVVAAVSLFVSGGNLLAAGALAGAACAVAAAFVQQRRVAAQFVVLHEQAKIPAAEREAAELAATLARTQIKELTAEVERLRAGESELLSAKRDAEAAALSKGEFLATMSHEIRTPLNGILPILELVLAAPLDEEIRHQVAAAFESAREMRRIVNDVLDYSKLEAGALQLETASLRPIELVGSVCTLMKRTAEAKQLRLHLEVDSSVPPVVRGDSLRLRQVMTNLIGNAIKFTTRGEVFVEVSQVAEDRTYRTLRVAVRDTGPGIAPESAATLFQPFSQADASTARAHGGTGLGLAICRRIIDAMGGRIGVDSALGRGSTFWFTVPLLRAAGEAVNLSAAAAHALLLTRDEFVADTWTRNLSALEFTTTRVGTAYETLSILRAASPSQGTSGQTNLLVIDLASASKTAASLTRPVLSEECFSQMRVLLLGDSSEGLIDGDHGGRVVLASRDLRDAAANRLVRDLISNRTPDAAALADGPEIRLSREPSQRFDGLRVLLVDDIAINRYAGQLSLQKLGAKVTQASGGREAIDLMRRTEFDIVLMDCQMPDVDGFAATRVQRLHERENGLRRMPVLAVTANAMPGDRERCLEAGMDDHLAKPIELGTLSRLLGKWTNKATPIDAGVIAMPILASNAEGARSTPRITATAAAIP